MDDFNERIKNVGSKIWQVYKKEIIIASLIILALILFLILIMGIIIQFEEENEKETSTYNPMLSYSFWWPVGGREISTDEDGNEYAVGDPSAVNISSDFTTRNPSRVHNGIDIDSIDTQDGLGKGKGYHYIIASKDGTVIVSHLSDTAGEYVAIDHGDGFVTKYMHMYEESRTVEVGDIVKQGQIIGIMGNTGSVIAGPGGDGTHLHFQIELNGTPVDPLEYVSADSPRGGATVDIFTTSISKEDFIQCIEQYRPSNIQSYQANMVPYAEDFYDICTEMGINAEFAFAHACLETKYGNSFRAQNNYFGYAAYNENPSAAISYETPADSIRSYCNWVIYNSTLGTSAYQESLQRAEELSPYNSMLVGTPETNVYVLYCRYAQLDSTHEGDYSTINRNDINSVKFLGTYYFTYYMYGEMCNHLPGEPTTDQEKADYAVYTTNLRIEIMNNIFGNK